MSKQEQLFDVSASFRRINYLRPPMQEVILDFKLDNHSTKPQWFLLPLQLEGDIQQTSEGVGGYEIYELGGSPHILMGRFIGSKGFQAVLLAANSTISLQGIPVKSASDVKGSEVAMKVLITENVLFEGGPLADTFKEDPSVPSGAVGSYDLDKIKHSRFVQEIRDFSVDWNEPVVIALKVQIK